MAAPVWTVIVFDSRSQPGVWRAQDMTALRAVDMQKTKLVATASPTAPKSTLVLDFPLDTPDLYIHEGALVWAGWRDPASGYWYDTPTPCFGGWIKMLAEGTEGHEKHYECTLTDFGYDIATTPVLGWPMLETDPDARGMPVGLSVTQWLNWGGGGWPGIIPAHLGNGFLADGIDPIFDTIIFNADTIPGTVSIGVGADGTQSQVYLDGQFGFIMLDAAIQAIVDAASWTWSKNYTHTDALVPGWWVRAVPSGTEIVPRFELRNLSDANGIVAATIAADADEAAGEIPVYHPYKHTRDLTGCGQRVVVKGLGGDVTQPGTPLVYADYANAAHLAQYPTRYQLNGGRCQAIINETRLHTVQLAVDLAHYVEQRTWGARGTIEMELPARLTEGTWVRYRDPNEGIDQAYPVRSVDPLPETGHYTTVIGFQAFDLQTLLTGGLPDVLLTQQDLAFSLGELTPQRTQPGTPPQVPLEMAPLHSDRNKIAPKYQDTRALRVQASTKLRPGAEDETRKANTFEAVGGDGKVRTSTGPDGEPHGHILLLVFTDNTPLALPIVSPLTIVRQEYLGTGTATYAVDGVPQALPMKIARGATLTVTPDGVSGQFVVALTEII